MSNVYRRDVIKECIKILFINNECIINKAKPTDMTRNTESVVGQTDTRHRQRKNESV